MTPDELLISLIVHGDAEVHAQIQSLPRAPRPYSDCPCCGDERYAAAGWDGAQQLQAVRYA